MRVVLCVSYRFISVRDNGGNCLHIFLNTHKLAYPPLAREWASVDGRGICRTWMIQARSRIDGTMQYLWLPDQRSVSVLSMTAMALIWLIWTAMVRCLITVDPLERWQQLGQCIDKGGGRNADNVRRDLRIGRGWLKSGSAFSGSTKKIWEFCTISCITFTTAIIPRSGLSHRSSRLTMTQSRSRFFWNREIAGAGISGI